MVALEGSLDTLKAQVESLGKELARLNLKVRITAADPRTDSREWYGTLLDAQATDTRLRFLLAQYRSLEDSLKGRS